MNVVIKPIAIGVATYVMSAVGLWFVLSLLLLPSVQSIAWLVPAAITLIPLFLSGYMAAKYTVSSHRFRRILFGVVAGVIGFGLSLIITKAHGETWFFGLFVLGAGVVAAAGGFTGTRAKKVAL